jgi:hypothetical protein
MPAGRPKLPDEEKKLRLTIRFSPEVIAYYRATGSGWQTRLNDDLLKLVRRRGKEAAAMIPGDPRREHGRSDSSTT